MLRETIISEIKKIEDAYDVKVCYAVESGSRAWGIPSEESDYDVSFIYVHRKDWYLSIDEKRDVIELPINNRLDINGWDIRKALKLFRKSNPPLFEWLYSEGVYYQFSSLVHKMKAIQNQVFIPQSALYHYVNMAKRNYRDYLQKDKIKIKKYFYILRPILACKWIEKYLTVPPVDLKVLLEEIIEDSFLKQEILTLMARKKSGEGSNHEPVNFIIKEYSELEIAHIEEFITTLEDTNKVDITPQLDYLFREILDEVWE